MFEQFKDNYPHLNENWDRYVGLWKRMEVPAKTILLREGDVSKRAFVVEKGCIRVWFNNKGKDITFQFMFENEVVSSGESFRKDTPSVFYLETIEPSVIYAIDKKDYNAMQEEMSAMPEFLKQMAEIAFDRQLHYMKHFLSFITETPKERYEKLLKEKPQLVRRVPQHYIASYLGITPVSLSRIRNKLLKEQ